MKREEEGGMKCGIFVANIIALAMVLAYTCVILIGLHYKFTNLQPEDILQVAMDMFAMALGLVLYVACVFDKEELNGMKRWYLWLVVADYAGLFLDAVSWFMGEDHSVWLAAVIVNLGIFVCSPLIAYIFFRYVLAYLDIQEDARIGKMLARMRRGAIAVVLIRTLDVSLLVFFQAHRVIAYRRGSLYFLLNIYSFVIGVIALFMVIRNRKKVAPYQVLILVMFVLAPLAAVISSVFFDGLLPMFSTMMAVLLSIYSVLNVEKSRERSAVETELSIANRMQEAMLPNLFPDRSEVPEYDLYATMNPAREVGGDFYDFFMLDDHRLAFLIADVSDKGVGAALFMAVSKAMVKMRAQLGGSPAEVIADVDERIGKDNDAGMFVTMWLGYLDLLTGHVVACNAGHDYPAIWLQERQAGAQADAQDASAPGAGSEGYVLEKTVHGPPVAFIPGMPFPEVEFDMKPGDRIFLYTDGVNEAQGSDGEEFGVERMLAALNAHKDLTSEALCKTMKETVDGFVGDDPQFDDMTMMALTFRAYQAA